MKHLLLPSFWLLILLSLQTRAQRRMNGRILVVSGGGARGAWGAGYIKSLDSLYGGYRIVFGTSTGSLMAPIIVLGKFGALKTAYTSVTQQSIFNVNPTTIAMKAHPIKIHLSLLKQYLQPLPSGSPRPVLP